jgi:hypothetical protein
MQRKRALPAARTKPTIFKVGQLWKVGDMNLVVTSLGKTLVHYKRYKTHPKGVQTLLSSKPDLEKYLLKSNAILAKE